MVRILIAAETRLYREGLAELLRRVREIRVVGTAADSTQCMARTRELGPDVVLLDITMPDSIHAVRSLGVAVPHTKVVAVAVPEVSANIVGYAEAGIAGYVTRDASQAELIHAVDSAAHGETLLSPRLAAELLRHVASMASRRGGAGAEARLTARELEIVQLIDKGLSNKEIASQLCIELPTVKNHVHHILEKLQVTRRAEAAAVLRDRRGPLPQDLDPGI